jgi:DNA-binding CsgD family transcriptional regulator
MYEKFFAGDAPPCSRLARVTLMMGEGFRVDHDDYSDFELAHDPFYQDFLRPQKAFWNAVAKLAAGPEQWGIELGLKREFDAGPYTPSERATLNTALLRLSAGARIAQRVQDARAEGLLQAVGAGADLIYELDAWGQVRREHGSELKRNLPLGILRGRLKTAAPTAQAALDEAVNGALAELARPTGAMLEARDGTRYFLQIIPLKGRAQDVFIGTTAVAILFSDTSVPRTRANMAMLRDLFTLTEREAEIARLIADGRSPAEVAQRLRIGIGTVRTHLKGAFAKTGTTRQSELAAVISRLQNQISG